MRDAVATLFDNKAVPVTVKFFIELFFNFPSNVRKVRYVMIFKSSQRCYYRVLDFVLRHVCSFNQHPLVCVCAKYVECICVITGHNRNLVAASASDPKSHDTRRRYIYHVNI